MKKNKTPRGIKYLLNLLVRSKASAQPPKCSRCDDTGWDGEGYSQTCAGCNPSDADLVLLRNIKPWERPNDMVTFTGEN